MTVQMILLPVFVQVALTFAMLFWMASARTRSVKSGETKIRDIALGQSAWPTRAQQISNNYASQFQIPLLFYVVVILALFTRTADLIFVVLSWLFVLARIAHTYVHATSNHVPTRFNVFAVGVFVLLDHVGLLRVQDTHRMTPAARLSAAIEVFADIEARRRPAAQALKDWGLSHRFAGSGDRAAIAGLVYDALRRKLSSAWIMGADTPRAVLLGMLARERGLDVEAISRLADGSRFAPEPLSDDEHARLRAKSLEGAPPHVRGDYPEWLDEKLAATFGDERAGGGGGARLARAARPARQHTEGDT